MLIEHSDLITFTGSCEVPIWAEIVKQYLINHLYQWYASYKSICSIHVIIKFREDFYYLARFISLFLLRRTDSRNFVPKHCTGSQNTSNAVREFDTDNQSKKVNLWGVKLQLVPFFNNWSALEGQTSNGVLFYKNQWERRRGRMNTQRVDPDNYQYIDMAIKACLVI